MRNIPKRIKDKVKSNKETIENVPYCRGTKDCKDKLLASAALKHISNYRKRVKFDGGQI